MGLIHAASAGFFTEKFLYNLHKSYPLFLCKKAIVHYRQNCGKFLVNSPIMQFIQKFSTILGIITSCATYSKLLKTFVENVIYTTCTKVFNNFWHWHNVQKWRRLLKTFVQIAGAADTRGGPEPSSIARLGKKVNPLFAQTFLHPISRNCATRTS